MISPMLWARAAKAVVALTLLCRGKDPSAASEASAPLIPYNMNRGGGGFGPSIAVDLCFRYYDRVPAQEVTRQIRERGFTCVHLADYGSSAITSEKLKAFATACRANNLVPALAIWPGTHSELYAAHPGWRQRMLTGADGHHDWRTYLCPNQPAFVAAYCDWVVQRMREAGLETVQLSEIWFENWGGPLADGKPNPRYACVCEACLSRFKQVAGEVNVLEMLTNSSSAAYFQKPENVSLYRQWVDMRVDTIQDFGKALITAVRKAFPKACIKIMYMADARVKLNGGREYLGNDLDRMVSEWKPDVLTLQDAWQDWLQVSLGANFVRDYAKAYKERVEKLYSGIFIMSHADIGSQPQSKRSPDWIRQFAQDTLDAGLGAPVFYEWSISTMAQ